MKHVRFFLPGIAFGISLAACGGGIPGTARQANVGAGSVPQWQTTRTATRTCLEPRPDESPCGLWISQTGIPPERAGWAPSDLQAAYSLPSSRGKGQIVAIVIAYDNPKIASDLATYRSHFGLPPAHFTKYNQYGQKGNYPKAEPADGESDLDVDMVSAVCPNCTIYLVEAKNFKNIGIAAKEAVKLGAHIVSNSYTWYPGRAAKSDYDTPGVVYVAAAGDHHYASNAPAKYDDVVSVGGTFLAKKGSKYREVVWYLTGGGCATDVPKPSWQHDPGCKYRTQNDVAAVSDDVADYDTYDASGWSSAYGTSIATPIIAGIYGLAGNASSQHGAKKLWTLTDQERKKYLHAITVGSNGSCGGSYLCTAGTGQYFTYSGPAGWGTPNGIGAF